MLRILLNMVLTWLGALFAVFLGIYVLNLDDYIEGGFPKIITFYTASMLFSIHLLLLSIIAGIVSKRYSLKMFFPLYKNFIVGFFYTFSYLIISTFVPWNWDVLRSNILGYIVYPILIYAAITLIIYFISSNFNIPSKLDAKGDLD